MKYIKGGYVRLLRDYGAFKKGDKLIIDYVASDQKVVSAKKDGCSVNLWTEYATSWTPECELVEEVVTNKYKVGNWVEMLKDYASARKGDILQIYQIISQGHVRVKKDGQPVGNGLFTELNQYREDPNCKLVDGPVKVEELPKTETMYKPQIEEWIIAVNPGGTYGCELVAGKAYKVKAIVSRGDYCTVDAPSGSDIFFKDIRKALSSEIPSESPWVPKVGDWCVVEHEVDTSRGMANNTSLKKGDIFRVSSHDYKMQFFKATDNYWIFPEGKKSAITLASIRKALPDEISGDWQPKVGEYAVMEDAGGWSYDPKNNGCVGLIDKVGMKYVDDKDVLAISGKLVNPKVECYGGKFNNIPISAFGKMVCRKALPHEIPQEDLLKEAKRRYPVGTTYLCASSSECRYTVVAQNFADMGGGTIWGESGKGCLRKAGRWAEIVRPFERVVVDEVPKYPLKVDDCIEKMQSEIIVKRNKKVGRRLILS